MKHDGLGAGGPIPSYAFGRTHINDKMHDQRIMSKRSWVEQAVLGGASCLRVEKWSWWSKRSWVEQAV